MTMTMKALRWCWEDTWWVLKELWADVKLAFAGLYFARKPGKQSVHDVVCELTPAVLVGIVAWFLLCIA